MNPVAPVTRMFILKMTLSQYSVGSGSYELEIWDFFDTNIGIEQIS
jgi:hypothetical protein